ncbi:OpgC domain-containing protein [Cellulomonas sp. 179-A 9B4 NHS]|uniref:OpgC domain-containing protein n=1 Tax=Cellulomonas sp. 179-A 9B4 NHS TaxID=3142379 RepID=UPI0039A275CC
MAQGGTGRLAAIDVVRGFCIVSMVTGHLAPQSTVSYALHQVPAFDGASGFVLLSGLVLGIVQSRRLTTHGLAAVERKSARRIGVIYVAQVSLGLLALAVAAVATTEHRNVHPAGTSTAEAVWRVLTLQAAPPAGSVLRLYVVLLALAMLAYVLLARGRWVAVLAGSAALYGVGYLVPQVTSFRSYSGELGANWATWQLLLVVALVVGWHWAPARIGERLLARPLLVTAVTGALVAAAWAGERVAPALYDKTMFGPARVLNAFAVVTLLFVVVSRLLEVLPRAAFRPIEVIGTRSLDSYVIQAGVAVVVPSFVVGWTDVALGVALATLALCWGWAELRRWRPWARDAVPVAPRPVDVAPEVVAVGADAVVPLEPVSRPHEEVRPADGRG